MASVSPSPIRTSPSCCRRICCCRGARIRQNVEFGLEIQGVPAQERRARSAALLAACRIADFAEHYPLSALGRHAAARGPGAHARRRSDRAAARRAVLRARRPDQDGAAAGSGADHHGDGQDRAVHHPRSRRGGGAVRPRAGDERSGPAASSRRSSIDLPDRDDCMRRREHPGIGALRAQADVAPPRPRGGARDTKGGAGEHAEATHCAGGARRRRCDGAATAPGGGGENHLSPAGAGVPSGVRPVDAGEAARLFRGRGARRRLSRRRRAAPTRPSRSAPAMR